jgi:cytochrome c-type biogenesis protein CcmE
LLKNKKFIIGGILVLAAIGFLSVRAFAGSATYYYNVAELSQKGATVYGQSVKVRGFVDEGSVVKQVQGAMLNFTLADDTRANKIPVTYQGVVPDTFKEGSELVCEGSLSKDGVFQATVLMPKCPSKYTPAPGQSG